MQAIGLVLSAVLLGAGTAALHGSGFLAVYLAGLLLSDPWARQDTSYHAVPAALSAAAEPLLFAMLGAAFAPLVRGHDADPAVPVPGQQRGRVPQRVGRFAAHHRKRAQVVGGGTAPGDRDRPI